MARTPTRSSGAPLFSGTFVSDTPSAFAAAVEYEPRLPGRASLASGLRGRVAPPPEIMYPSLGSPVLSQPADSPGRSPVSPAWQQRTPVTSPFHTRAAMSNTPTALHPSQKAPAVLSGIIATPTGSPARASQGSPDFEIDLRFIHLRDFLRQFYSRHNPAMLRCVDSVSAQYCGDELALYHKMLMRYPEQHRDIEWLAASF
eukprot:TRINITY_DN21636_c0_g1_i1.p1 TRINITY_DN21636_c0_g1~~TRINITY_DN21636_c0_g1_i1.p1  ORF type:complete len:201 (+),score=50.69 TRINITY_DN21636_c0_g1_i1:54-656(+)